MIKIGMTDLEKSILATLGYYDILDQPLTAWEIFQYLQKFRKPREKPKGASSNSRPKSLFSILKTLETSPDLTKLISQKNGFYFLKGRSGLVRQRIERQKIADQKWKKIRRIVQFLQLIPFVRLVAVSGSLAMHNTKEESDMDLLIVAKNGRIWTCRGLVTLFIHLIGQRRHGKLTKNRVCLNHYLTEKSLKIPFKSLYNAQTYIHLVPLWQAEKGLYRKFQKANKWLNDYLFFNPKENQGYLTRVKSNQVSDYVRKFQEFLLKNKLGQVIEFIFKKFQESRIKRDPLTYQVGGRVVFNDQQLEFHPDSPEKAILEKYNQRMRELGLAELANEKDSGLIRRL
jgi:predicted nucleotidyltransferase